MKSYADYIKLRESDESDSINPSETEDSNHLFRLIRLAWKAHQSKTREFFSKLAAIDSEIAAELEEIGDDFDIQQDKQRQDSMMDKDHVVKPSADRGVGLGDDQENQ